MSWYSFPIALKPRSRGFHLITHEILPQLEPALSSLQVGLALFFCSRPRLLVTLSGV